MKNVALAQLQQQIEAVRREAYAQGYAAAMQRVQELAARPPDGPGALRSVPPVTPIERSGLSRRRYTPKYDRLPMPRPPSGTNARMIAAVLESIAPRAARPSETRHLLLSEK